MPSIKIYEPHCPEYRCSGGSESRLYQETAGDVQIPPDILSRKKPLDDIYRCSYCGFVWFQDSSLEPGFDPTPAGFYDNFSHPLEFISVPRNHRIREENTPRYWAKIEEQRLKRRSRRR